MDDFFPFIKQKQAAVFSASQFSGGVYCILESDFRFQAFRQGTGNFGNPFKDGLLMGQGSFRLFAFGNVA